MRIRLLFLASVLALTSSTWTADMAAAWTEPDHLEPLDPYPFEWKIRYLEQVRSRLKLDSLFLAQMVVRPSFSGEFVVRLHCEKDKDFDTAKHFFLAHSIADKSIWYSMPGPGNPKGRQRKVSVATTTGEIPKPLATRILKLWERMLLRMRYSEQRVILSEQVERVIITDGTIFEFGVPLAYGETHSPVERKSPLLLIEVGESLVSYCKATAQDRPAAATEIENKAAQLEQYLDEHPPK